MSLLVCNLLVNTHYEGEMVLKNTGTRAHECNSVHVTNRSTAILTITGSILIDNK